MTATKLVTNKDDGNESKEIVILSRDKGNRPGTTLDGLANLKPILGEGTTITAGNASQLADGGSVAAWGRPDCLRSAKKIEFSAPRGIAGK